MTKLKVALVRDVMNQHLREEISFSRAVEILNEKQNEVIVKKLDEAEKSIKSNDLTDQQYSDLTIRITVLKELLGEYVE